MYCLHGPRVDATTDGQVFLCAVAVQSLSISAQSPFLTRLCLLLTGLWLRTQGLFHELSSAEIDRLDAGSWKGLQWAGEPLRQSVSQPVLPPSIHPSSQPASQPAAIHPANELSQQFS